jgi:hypothetical protein
LAGIEPAKLGDEYLPYPFQLHPCIPHPSATSPDARLLASVVRTEGLYEGDQRSRSYTTSTVEVREAATGRKLHALIGHTANVICIAFSPDGRRIATAGYDRTVKLWDTATGREVFTLRGHTAGVIALAFSPDSRRIVSSGLDDTARVWDATPLPAGILQAEDARYHRKQTELEASRDRPKAKRYANGGNRPYPEGQWDVTASALAKTVEGDPNNLFPRYLHLLALVLAGNRAGVQRACEDVLKRFGNATDPVQANQVAWYCVLAPDAVADHDAPVRLAAAALAGLPEGGKARSDVLITLGAAQYRAGRFEEAIRCLDESTQVGGGGGVPRGFAFLAQAHHRLGHHGEAKRWLDKLVASQPNEGFEMTREDVEIRILRREAESLVLGSRAAAAPSAPVAPS